MTKEIGIMDIEYIRKVNQFESEILNIMDNKEDYTQSDLQGAVSAVIMNAINAGKQFAKGKE